MKYQLLVSLSLASLAASACGAPETETVAPQTELTVLPIEGGELSRRFAATGGFRFDDKFICTGTLIAPDIVLTAAHCFSDAPADKIPGVTFRLGTDLDAPVAAANLSEVIIHPDFDGQRMNDFNYLVVSPDIAIARLAAPIDTIAPISLDFTDATTLLGKEMVLVGYGRQADDHISGIRREATVTIDEVSDFKLRYTYEGSSACNGDSGGPSFIEFSDGFRQVGITSGGPDSCREVGYYTRIDIFESWLAQQGVDTGRRAVDCGQDSVCDGACAQDPDCEETLCPSGSCTEPTQTCVADAACDPTCGGTDPDCVADGTSEDPCDTQGLYNNGVCNSGCAMADPDCNQAQAPPCYFVERHVDQGWCTYTDQADGRLCGQWQLYCDPTGCYCPY